MKLSNRVLSIKHSPIRKFYVYTNEAKANGKKVYFINIGQPDIKTPKVFFDAIRSFEEPVLEYAPSEGIKELIDAIIRYYKRYGMNYTKDNILITNGGSEALTFVMSTILDPGDEVITAEPFYSNYSTFVATADGVIKPITTIAEDGYHYASREKIEAAITKKTKAILITNPGNPTGNILSKDEMRLICDIAKENGLYIVADEVYREFVYDGKSMTSFGEFEDVSDNVIIIDSISKRFSACGARIGTIITKNEEVISNLMKLAQGRLCTATIDQIGAAALYNLDPSYFDEVKKEYEHRRDVVYRELKKIEGVVCEKPGGAFYITCKLPISNSEDFLVWMLKNFDDNGETVMFAPAEGFYKTPGLGANEIRIAYVLNEHDMIRSIEIMGKALEEYKRTQVK